MAENKPWRVFLDVEGIAFDPLPAITTAVRRAAVRVGAPISLHRDLSWVTEVWPETMLSTLLGDDSDRHRMFLQHLQHYYCDQTWRVLPACAGIGAALRDLRTQTGAELMLVSAHDMDTAWRQVVEQGLDDLFDGAVCPQNGCCSQCRQRILADATQRSLATHRVAWLTDMPPELMYARLLGVTGIAAAWGRVPVDVLQQGQPAMTAYHPDELVAALNDPLSLA